MSDYRTEEMLKTDIEDNLDSLIRVFSGEFKDILEKIKRDFEILHKKMEEELGEYMDKVDRLEADIEDHEADFNDERSIRSDLEDEVSDLKDKIENLEAEIIELKEELSDD